MPTIADLGRKVKSKYPGQYDDLSDEEVGRRVKAKYPTEYADFEDTGLATTSYGGLAHSDPSLERKIQRIWDRHDPDMGNVVSWWRRRRIDGQNKYLQSANEQQRLLIEQASILSEAYARQQRGEAEFKIFLAQNAAELHLLSEAAKNGMTIPDWSAYNREQRYHEINLSRIKAEAESKVYQEAQMSQIRLREEEIRHQLEMEKLERKQRLETETRGIEYSQDQENIDRLDLTDLIISEKKREQLNKLYDEEVILTNSSDPAKARKLRAIKAQIDKLEAELGV